MGRANVINLTRVRARLALEMAQALTQRIQFRVIDGEETGEVWGHPKVLAGLCAYIGAGKRDTSRWSVYLEPRYRQRLKLIRGSFPPVGAEAVQ